MAHRQEKLDRAALSDRLCHLGSDLAEQGVRNGYTYRSHDNIGITARNDNGIFTRCRKIRQNTGDAYAPTVTEPSDETYDNPKIFVATGALIIAFVAAVGYAAYQFRAELKQLFRKIFRRKSKV